MKKLSIFLMLMALFAPLAMNAQTTATFNEGTTTSTYLPFYGSYADYGTKGQFIIPATDLANKGITSGSQISKLTFYSNATSGGTFFGSSRIVEVGEVSYSTFSTNANTFVTSGLTTVLSGTPNTLTRNADGTMEVSFSSNYTYNGGNLLISIGGYGSNYKSTSWYGVNTNNAGVYGNQSYSNSGSIPTTATMVSFAPKTTITYIPGSTPYLTLNPTSATVLTGFTETLTASYGNVTGTPTITYTSSDTNVATVTGNGTTATVTAIAEGTATITATMSYEGTDYPATCDITVMDACQPTWGSSPSYYITNLTVNKSGTTLLTNSSTGTAGTTTNYYATQSITAEPGDELSCVITMSSSSTYGFAMWVDFDQDGLDSGDLITSTSSYSSSPYTITLDIPTNASSGEYRMRICGDWSKQSFTDPCGAFSNGEAEDYKLIVNAGAYHVTCNATTNGTITVNHGSADAGETITVTATPDTNYELTALSYNDGTDHSISFSNNQGSFTMPAADVTVSATFSLIRTLPPYDLTVGTPGGHSVELGWTGVSTNTNHQNYEVYYSTTNTAPSDNLSSGYETTTTESYTLMGLTAETTYYAWVRDNCGTDGKSAWVAFTSFTTDVACPAPTNVAANHITNNTAEISWEGNADSYNVRYRPNTSSAVFFEGFEEGLPSTWTTIDSDGDGFNWDYHINTGSGNYTTHTGNGVAISASYDKDGGTGALTPDNWLITPQLDLQGTMRVWLCGQDTDDYLEHFAIYLSTTGTEITDFTTTLIGETVTGYDMVEYTADLSDYAGQQGYIAIRHFNCTDQFWLNVDDFGIYTSETWNTASSSILTGLTSETEYEVQVQANCGSEDGTSAWVGTTFTTLDDCAVPYELEVANPIAPTSTLTWTGAQDNYNVRYRTETFGEPQEYVFEEGFEGGSMPTGWTTTGSDWIITSGTGNSSYTGSATGNYNAGCYISSYSGSDILITPAIDLSQATSATLTFNFWNTSWGGDINTLNVYYRVDGGNWSNALYTNNSQVTPWTSISVTLPSSGFAANYQIGFECVSNYSYGMGIDDVKITYTAPSIIYGEWVNKPNVTSPLDITNLTPSTTYEWQVQGVNCDGNNTATDWSTPATFTTLEGYIKDIAGYGDGGGNYYLIASPVGEVSPEDVTHMLSNSYDLYYFDQSQDFEWINYKPDEGSTDPGFNLMPGKGYLYANRNDVTLSFIGQAYNGSGDVTLYKDDNAEFPGWNLVGNPFAQTAYTTKPFYTMNPEGTELVAGDGNEVDAMQGIFVIAEEDEEIMNFSTDPIDSKGQIVLNVTQDRGAAIDRAIVRFGQADVLPKFMLNQNSTKMYIPKNGNDYAVVRSNKSGSFPVSFEPAEDGIYSISVNAENTVVRYLHLIDRETGEDINLLQTPRYTFAAKTTSKPNRFELVFRTGSNLYKERIAKGGDDGEGFGFFSNGNWIIDNEGDAILQVVDVNGQILSSERINGCVSKRINAAPGIYILRLINGEDVYVQKIVIQ